MSFKFTKPERLSSKTEIDQLFAEGKNIKSGKLLCKVMLRDQPEWPYCKYLVVVPKRRVRRAVDRNRIKRQLREVIRLNKSKVEVASNKRVLLAVIYQGNNESVYGDLERDYIQVLQSLNTFINKN